MATFIVLASLMVGVSLFALSRPRQSAGDAGIGRRPIDALLIVAIPVLTIAGYLVLGRPDALDPPQDADRLLAEQRTARLAERLATRPEDTAGWRLLARSYEQLRRFDDATHAYARLVALHPDDADALVDQSEARSMAQGGSYTGEPIALARRALALEPDHPRALAIAANEAAQRDDLPAAIADWERIRARVAPESEVDRSLQRNIDEARQAMATAARARMQTASVAAGR